MSNYKFIHENKSIELSQDKSLFDLADQVKMRIPTSCGRVGDCHECIDQESRQDFQEVDKRQSQVLNFQ